MHFRATITPPSCSVGLVALIDVWTVSESNQTLYHLDSYLYLYNCLVHICKSSGSNTCTWTKLACKWQITCISDLYAISFAWLTIYCEHVCAWTYLPVILYQVSRKNVQYIVEEVVVGEILDRLPWHPRSVEYVFESWLEVEETCLSHIWMAPQVVSKITHMLQKREGHTHTGEILIPQ